MALDHSYFAMLDSLLVLDRISGEIAARAKYGDPTTWKQRLSQKDYIYAQFTRYGWDMEQVEREVRAIIAGTSDLERDWPYGESIEDAPYDAVLDLILWKDPRYSDALDLFRQYAVYVKSTPEYLDTLLDDVKGIAKYWQGTY